MSAPNPQSQGVFGAIAGMLGFSVLAGILVTVMLTPGLAVTSITASNTIGVFDALPDYIELGDQPQENVIYAKASEGGEDVAIATVYSQNRQEVKWDEVAQVVKDATIAGEDIRFYEHGGVDVQGLIRATLRAAEYVPNATVFAVPLASRPNVRSDDTFRKQVVDAYAPGADVWWPTGRGNVGAAIADVVESDRPTGLDRGVVVFFTGLSGSGKSTLAQALCNRLIETGGRTVTLLDGDRVRRNVSRGLTFSREDRELNIERIAWIAAEVARHGGMAVCAPIAPFDRTRKAARAMAAEVGAEFALIHVATPLEVCEARDRKGLYKRARRGEVADFTGISSPYEVPVDADLVVDTSAQSVEDALATLTAFLVDRGWLPEQ